MDAEDRKMSKKAIALDLWKFTALKRKKTRKQ
jgi:hypothetical protein